VPAPPFPYCCMPAPPFPYCCVPAPPYPHYCVPASGSLIVACYTLYSCSLFSRFNYSIYCCLALALGDHILDSRTIDLVYINQDCLHHLWVGRYQTNLTPRFEKLASSIMLAQVKSKPITCQIVFQFANVVVLYMYRQTLPSYFTSTGRLERLPPTIS
jgi:hypothetical protein